MGSRQAHPDGSRKGGRVPKSAAVEDLNESDFDGWHFQTDGYIVIEDCATFCPNCLDELLEWEIEQCPGCKTFLDKDSWEKHWFEVEPEEMIVMLPAGIEIDDVYRHEKCHSCAKSATLACPKVHLWQDLFDQDPQIWPTITEPCSQYVDSANWADSQAVDI